MREALPEDCRIVYELSSDPEIRAASFHQEPISYSSHVQWFFEKIDCEDHLFLLFFSDGKFVGQIRFQRDKDSVARVSISLTPVFRGAGLATAMMEDALKYVKKKWHIEKVAAYIKVSNKISNAFFSKAGYRFLEQMTVNGSLCNVCYYEYR